jgi:hypothetical protein
MKYFDKYKYIIITFNSVIESKQIQEFLIGNNILWGGDSRTVYSDVTGYYMIGRHSTNDFLSIGFTDNINDPWVKREYFDNSNNIIYTIRKFNSFKNIILHGNDIPSYKPKKIKRVL